jgi:hypothetical protein
VKDGIFEGKIQTFNNGNTSKNVLHNKPSKIDVFFHGDVNLELDVDTTDFQFDDMTNDLFKHD